MKIKFLDDYISNNHTFDKMTMIAILSLMIVFSGVFGWVYEVIFYYFNVNREYISWQGGNFLPWINIYAIGGLIIYFTTYKYRASWVKVFLISTILCGLLEYIAGLGVYIFTNGDRYWNYNIEILNFGNIQGFICLRSVLFFGVSGLFLIYAMVPLCFYLAKKINRKLFLTVSISLACIFLADEIYNSFIVKMFNLTGAIKIYTELGIKRSKFL